MRSDIVHPSMLKHLQGNANFFPDVVSIEEVTLTQNALNEPVEAWAKRDGMGALPCARTPSGGLEVKAKTGVYTLVTDTILIPGSHDIKDTNRAVIGTTTFNILLVERDTFSGMTRLRVEVVT